MNKSRKNDPVTSQMASDDAKVKLSLNEKLILEALGVSIYGMTIAETADVLEKPMQTISTRFAPLRRKKMIVDSGFQRKNASGSWAIIWMLNDGDQKVEARKQMIERRLPRNNERKTSKADVLTPEKQRLKDGEMLIEKMQTFLKDHGDGAGFACRNHMRHTIDEIRRANTVAASNIKNGLE